MNGKNKLLLFFFITFSVIHNIHSQINIDGKVKFKDQGIGSANIILKNLNNNIISFTHTDDKGYYTLKLVNKGKFNISISCLGFKTKTISVNIENSIKLDISLDKQILELDEVLIKSEKDIIIKKDTISVKAKKFLTGKETNIEDLLKKIPGLNIDYNGVIKVGNKEIEKLMVDGDDFFDKGYKILSKNMPPEPIDRVEIIQNYSSNALLKGIEDSDKVALNLTLKKESKRVWFGNIETGYGLASRNRYTFRNNLMNFGKKNKYYFLTQLNNIGYDATGDINHLVKSKSNNDWDNLGNNEDNKEVLKINKSTPALSKELTNFNNAELLSINGIFKLNKKIKLKTLGFFNWDEHSFNKKNEFNFTSNGQNFKNIDIINIRDKFNFAYSKIDFLADLKENKKLDFTTKFNRKKIQDFNENDFNSKNQIEKLSTINTYLSSKINFTKRHKNKKRAILFTGRFIYDKISQNYKINELLHNHDYSLDPYNESVNQLINNNMQYIGIQGYFLTKINNKNLFEFKLGNQLRRDNFFSFLKFNMLKEEFTSQKQINSIIFNNNNTYLSLRYKNHINKKIFLRSSIIVNNYFSYLLAKNNKSQHHFGISPKIKVLWNINDSNTLSAIYQRSIHRNKPVDVYFKPIITSNRSFSTGLNHFNQLPESNYRLIYNLGNWNDDFFVNSSISYNKKQRFITTNSTIKQSYTITKKILSNNGNAINIAINANKFFYKISSDIKLKFNYLKFKHKNIINNSDLRIINSENYNYGLEIRSSFPGIINYHTGINYSINSIRPSNNKSIMNHKSFFDLLFSFSDSFLANFQLENYSFNADKHSKYLFSNFDIRYKLKKQKINISLTGKNLFNTKKIKNSYITDFGYYQNEYELIPRYILLKAEFKF